MASPAPPAPAPPRRLCIWDFDKSAVELNTDDLVPRACAGDELVAHIRTQYRAGRGWNALMDEVCTMMHERGVTRADIEAALRTMPVAADMMAAIREAAASGVPVHIVSDANAVYIDVLLDHLGLKGCITAVHTNPAHWDADGRLRIGPYVPPHSPHGCGRCPVNMCKGAILRDVLRVLPPASASPAAAGAGAAPASPAASVGSASSSGAKEGAGAVDPVDRAAAAGAPPPQAQAQAASLGFAAACAIDAGAAPEILYVGDGGGDVCPVLRMHARCVVCARAENPMLEELAPLKAAGAFAPELVCWASGADVLAAVRAFVARGKGEVGDAPHAAAAADA